MAESANHWDELWSTTIRDKPQTVATRPPNSYVAKLVEDLAPGRAIDAGCGLGAESRLLAHHGWSVTSVDISRAVLQHGDSVARALGDELSGRITWVNADLATWVPEINHYDLVMSLYTHIPGPPQAMVQRLANGVAVGGTLLLIGHQPIDPSPGSHTSAHGHSQLTLAEGLSALDESVWKVVVAEERPHSHGGGNDAIIHAERLV